MLKITATGNLGRRSELKDVGGKKVLNFSIAANEGWGDNQKTTWVDCAVWGARAEKLAEHLDKGVKVLVRGGANLDTYQKKDGTTGYAFRVFVNDLEFMGGRPQKSPNAPASSSDAGTIPSDIPF